MSGEVEHHHATSLLVAKEVAEAVKEAFHSLPNVQSVTPMKWMAVAANSLDKEGSQPEPKIIFFLGGPGSAKREQSALVVEEFDFFHIDVKKELKALGSNDALALLKKAVPAAASHEWIAIDGFPRSIAEALEFESVIGFPHFVLYFNASEAVLRERYATEQPNAEADAFNRMARIFKTNVAPLVEYYRATHRLEEVSAIGSMAAMAQMVRPLFIPKARYPKVVFILGGPGSGKGTQCARLVAKYKCAHLSTGDLLRDEVKSGSGQGKFLQEVMAKGLLVEMSIVMGLLRRALCSLPEGVPFVLLDGFPRDMCQTLEVQRIAECAFALAFHVSDEILVQRVLGRGQGRIDDNIESIKLRLDTFHTHSEGVLQYYKALDRLHLIDSTPSADEVWALVDPLFKDL